MKIEKGKTYQSRNFPHITRKVVKVKDGIVTYQIINSQTPNDPFLRMTKAVLSEFEKCTAHEVLA